jgi:hypothetical protein
VEGRLVPLAVLVLLAVVGIARAVTITDASIQDPTQRMIMVSGDVMACLALLAEAVLLYEISRVVGRTVGGAAGGLRLSWTVVVALAVSVLGYLSRAHVQANPFWPEVGVAAAGMLGLLVTAGAAAGRLRPHGIGRMLRVGLGAAAAGAIAAVLVVRLAGPAGTVAGPVIHAVSPPIGLALLGLLAAVPGIGSGEGSTGAGPAGPSTAGDHQPRLAVFPPLPAVLAAVAALVMLGITGNAGAAVVLFAGGFGIASFRPGMPDPNSPPAMGQVARYFGTVLAAGVLLWLLAGLFNPGSGEPGGGADAAAGAGPYKLATHALGPAGGVILAALVAVLLVLLAGSIRHCRDDAAGRWATGVLFALAAQAALSALAALGVAAAAGVSAPLLGPDAMSYAVTLVGIGLVFGASCRAAPAPTDTPTAGNVGQLAAGGRT